MYTANIAAILENTAMDGRNEDTKKGWIIRIQPIQPMIQLDHEV